MTIPTPDPKLVERAKAAIADLFTFEDHGRKWPFFGDEDGNYFGLGHQDPVAFATAVREWLILTADQDDDLDDLVAAVEHVHAVLDESTLDEEYVQFDTTAKADDPSSFAVTRLLS